MTPRAPKGAPLGNCGAPKGQAYRQYPHPMHVSLLRATIPSGRWNRASTGQTATHGALEQCMHGTATLVSPGSPSLMVTTRILAIPAGTLFSFLHATSHPPHSMQRLTSI